MLETIMLGKYTANADAVNISTYATCATFIFNVESVQTKCKHEKDKHACDNRSTLHTVTFNDND